MTYDQRHGYRGPERRLPTNASDAAQLSETWRKALRETAVIADLQPAIVTAVDEEANLVRLLLRDGASGELLFANGVEQARPYRTENYTGPAPANVAEVFAPGDMIRVQRDADGAWQLSQVPAAQAALVSLDPNNGAILSVVGGMGFELSKFNRATQAQRQPGSNFKPFVYSAALDAGLTAATIINDAPVVMQDSSLEDIWRPENDSGEFYGPTRLRWALTKSRNLVSIRVLQQIGVRRLIDYVAALGFDTSKFTPDLSLALGTLSMTPLEVATAYAILANGGYRVEPYLIQRIDDVDGQTLYEARPPTVCAQCADEGGAQQAELSMEEILAGASTQRLPPAPRVMEERVNFIMDSILRDVITRGTGRKALVLERGDIAGKTGTTNGPMDAWFSGYNRHVVTSTWVGFDNYTPLGRREFGGTAALPIWIDFMREALADSPQQERPLPEGIVNVRIDPVTGLLAPAGQRDAIFEYFREEYVPRQGVEEDPHKAGNLGTDDLIQDIF